MPGKWRKILDKKQKATYQPKPGDWEAMQSMISQNPSLGSGSGSASGSGVAGISGINGTLAVSISVLVLTVAGLTGFLLSDKSSEVVNKKSQLPRQEEKWVPDNNQLGHSVAVFPQEFDNPLSPLVFESTDSLKETNQAEQANIISSPDEMRPDEQKIAATETSISRSLTKLENQDNTSFNKTSAGVVSSIKSKSEISPHNFKTDKKTQGQDAVQPFELTETDQSVLSAKADTSARVGSREKKVENGSGLNRDTNTLPSPDKKLGDENKFNPENTAADSTSGQLTKTASSSGLNTGNAKEELFADRESGVRDTSALAKRSATNNATKNNDSTADDSKPVIAKKTEEPGRDKMETGLSVPEGSEEDSDELLSLIQRLTFNSVAAKAEFGSLTSTGQYFAWGGGIETEWRLSDWRLKTGVFYQQWYDRDNYLTDRIVHIDTSVLNSFDTTEVSWVDSTWVITGINQGQYVYDTSTAQIIDTVASTVYDSVVVNRQHPAPAARVSSRFSIPLNLSYRKRLGSFYGDLGVSVISNFTTYELAYSNDGQQNSFSLDVGLHPAIGYQPGRHWSLEASYNYLLPIYADDKDDIIPGNQARWTVNLGIRYFLD